MKKILLITLLSVLFTSTFAQFRLAENFGDWSGSGLVSMGTTNSWVSVNTGDDAQVMVQSNNTNALTTTGYTSGQNYVRLNKVNGLEKYKLFGGSGSVSTSSSSTFYVSFVVKLDQTQATVSESNADYSFSLHNTASSSAYPCRFYARIDDGGNVEFGISKTGNSATKVWSNIDGNSSNTFLIVMRYDVVSGSKNDRVYLWVNPSLATAPTTSSATLSYTTTGGGSSNDDPSYGSAINAIILHQRNSTNSPIIFFDGFRVSNAETSGPAWDGLSAAGAPLPVTFGAIKASEKGTGVQIDWTSYSESNLANYQIERSADGIHFSSIGEVAPRNVAEASNYSFFDALPLSGTSFYRIRNNDIDGKSGLSNIVKINLNKNIKTISVYPNPIRGNRVSFQTSDLAKGSYNVEVINAVGSRVFQQSVNHAGGAINQSLNLPTLQSGQYTLRINGTSSSSIHKITILQ
jgi:hypothetical protein